MIDLQTKQIRPYTNLNISSVHSIKTDVSLTTSSIFTGQNFVSAKVIFLHLSVIHSVHRGGVGVSEISRGVYNFRVV